MSTKEAEEITLKYARIHVHVYGRNLQAVYDESTVRVFIISLHPHTLPPLHPRISRLWNPRLACSWALLASGGQRFCARGSLWKYRKVNWGVRGEGT